MAITIRPITDLTGCADLQMVHNSIWGNSDDEIIPTHVLITWATNNCVLLGAYDSDGPQAAHGMVGFALGWYGVYHTPTPQLKYCSHIVGVLPEYRGRDIGLRLKLAQRETILRDGQTNLMSWTYDPLQIVNGNFNIHRLGAVCYTYKRDVYGEMNDALNAGAPSDRFQVDWHMESDRVNQHLNQQFVAWDASELVYPVSVRDNMPYAEKMPAWDGQAVAVPLPEQLAMLRTHDKSRLLAWRMMQRSYVEAGFAAGYQVVDCVQVARRGWQYILMPEVQ
jgi:predicted GNAT superfamily acetyltransferase